MIAVDAALTGVASSGQIPVHPTPNAAVPPGRSVTVDGGAGSRM